MNYGSEIFIDRDRIHLTDSLLEPLSAAKNTPLYGLYYPPPEYDPFVSAKKQVGAKRDYSKVDVRHDLMLTPVPMAFWSRALAGRIDIRHAPGTLSRVLAALRDEGLNILLFRCSRANHRYATVHFVAALEMLSPDLARPLDATTKDRRLYTKTEAIERNNLISKSSTLGSSENGKPSPNPDKLYAELVNYSARLRSECSRLEARLVRRLSKAEDWERLSERLRYRPVSGDSQYDSPMTPTHDGSSDGANFDLKEYLDPIEPLDCLQYDQAFGRRPLSLWFLAYLSYFYSVANCAWRTPPTLPITAKVVEKNTLQLSDSEALCVRTGLGAELPTVGFATLDTEAYLIRLAVVSRHHLRNFRAAEITYQYSYTGGTAPSMGILADLLMPLSEDWNLWRAYNSQSRWEQDYEIGRITLVMDHVPKKFKESTPSDDEIIAMLRSAIQRPNLFISNITLRPFSSRRIFISIKGVDQLERAREILELCKDVGTEFGYMKNNIRTVESSLLSKIDFGKKLYFCPPGAP